MMLYRFITTHLYWMCIQMIISAVFQCQFYCSLLFRETRHEALRSHTRNSWGEKRRGKIRANTASCWEVFERVRWREGIVILLVFLVFLLLLHYSSSLNFSIFPFLSSLSFYLFLASILSFSLIFPLLFSPQLFRVCDRRASWRVSLKRREQ